MPSKRPVLNSEPIPSPDRGNCKPRKLMDMQDTVFKGDGKSVHKTTINFRIPIDLKDRAEEYAATNGMTLTQIILDGIRWRISQEY